MPNTFYTKSYQQGQAIFQEGQDGSYACLISQGSVEVCLEGEGQKVTLSVLGRGDLFGEMALIGTDKRTASVLALEYTEVVIFDRDRLNKALAAGSPLLNNLVHSLIQRLAATTAKVRHHADPAGQLVPLAHLARVCLESCPADAQGYHNLPLAKLTEQAQAIMGLPAKAVKDCLLLLARHHLLVLERVGQGTMLRVKDPDQLPSQTEALAQAAPEEVPSPPA
jgi:hypothetical protein